MRRLHTYPAYLCPACGNDFFKPAPICPRCGGPTKKRTMRYWDHHRLYWADPSNPVLYESGGENAFTAPYCPAVYGLE